MAIINGQYVNDTIPENFTDQSVTGIAPGRKDWSDSKLAQYNYLLKQQEQAYNLQLWNLSNEYNSPTKQMKRYQDAGLNPFLIYGQQNTASAPASASALSFRSGGNFNKGLQSGLQAIGQIMNTVKAARETYDYMKYGSETSRWNMIATQEAAYQRKLDVAWNDWLLHGDNMIYGDTTRLPQGPRASRYQTDTNLAGQRIAQLKQLISASVTGEERTRALQALDDYRLSIMKGQNDAVLNINTGRPGLDAFLQLLSYFLLNNARSFF